MRIAGINSSFLNCNKYPERCAFYPWNTVKVLLELTAKGNLKAKVVDPDVRVYVMAKAMAKKNSEVRKLI